MNDKEALILAIGDYAGSMTKNLFGLNLSVGGSALIKMGVENLIKKEPYKIVVDFFFDENNNLLSINDFFDALEDVMNQRPYTIMGVRFNGSDVKELRQEFIKNKQK